MTVAAVKPDGEAIGGLPLHANARGISDHETQTPIGLRMRRGSAEGQCRTSGRNNKTQPFHGQHFVISPALGSPRHATRYRVVTFT